MNTWDSARRAQLHKSVLAVVLSGIFIFLAAVEISAIDEPQRSGAWSGFGVVAALALICSAAFFAYSTLRGPQFEEDPAKREAQQVRNRALGLLVFGIVWVVTVLWLRDLLLRLPLIPLYAALGGFLAGAFIGVAGVWYLHHRRGRWPPDHAGPHQPK